jgi:hypothetical protein
MDARSRTVSISPPTHSPRLAAHPSCNTFRALDSINQAAVAHRKSGLSAAAMSDPGLHVMA